MRGGGASVGGWLDLNTLRPYRNGRGEEGTLTATNELLLEPHGWDGALSRLLGEVRLDGG